MASPRLSQHLVLKIGKLAFWIICVYRLKHYVAKMLSYTILPLAINSFLGLILVT